MAVLIPMRKLMGHPLVADAGGQETGCDNDLTSKRSDIKKKRGASFSFEF